MIFWRQFATEGRRGELWGGWRWLEVRCSAGQWYWQSSWGQSPHSRGTSCRAPQSLSSATSRNLILHWISGYLAADIDTWHQLRHKTVPHTSPCSHWFWSAASSLIYWYNILYWETRSDEATGPAGECDARPTCRWVLGTSIFNETGGEQNCFYELHTTTI